MNLLSALSTAIKTQLITNATLASALAEGSDYRIFLQQAPGDASYPYIRMRKFFGGETNVAPGHPFDTQWRIEVISKSGVQAETLFNEVEPTLKDALPPLPSGHGSKIKVTMGEPTLDPTIIQGEQYWAFGAMFRLRGSEE